jgi:hypothetical protein
MIGSTVEKQRDKRCLREEEGSMPTTTSTWVPTQKKEKEREATIRNGATGRFRNNQQRPLKGYETASFVEYKSPSVDGRSKPHDKKRRCKKRINMVGFYQCFQTTKDAK